MKAAKKITRGIFLAALVFLIMPVLANAAELCGNNMDDDGDGQIDEGCACTPGQTRQCGPATDA
ncbi:MAG: hypothetical protein N3D84_04000, partial [Candidatus Woesearchaeota archaeon]|nr:hypothetical protein [Candidatus Woesearchaeota archaeon]